MMRDENGYLRLRPPEDSIEIEETELKTKLLDIINSHSKWPDIYDYRMDSWTNSIMEDAEILNEEIENKISKKYSIEKNKIIINPIKYTKISIYCEVLDTLFYALGDDIIFEDIPMIKNFLNTPLGKEQQAWEQWNEYWKKKGEQEKKKIKESLRISLKKELTEEFSLFKEKSNVKQFHLFIIRRLILIKGHKLLDLERVFLNIEQKTDYIRLLFEISNFSYNNEEVDWSWISKDRIKEIMDKIEAEIALIPENEIL